ncbi:tctex1 domain-containing protein 2 [Biomphalaria glabrata]|uniref:Dynein light chain Tctex-type protein 2B-like n=1 Tax=Biomphalaria glabrata TaxID=6526 RepID=A0A2C9KTG2_BIOGL|nr:dynein light chain Tctex-type protein 2B-like [Biomphalaria glabrata]KAI8733471.1 tctex1 domain-containing protein 2-like [Biomphalaria glabrata]KAI8743646.1 tctex1 domain-containing protein 2 [Biomphalaria glabrata]
MGDSVDAKKKPTSDEILSDINLGVKSESSVQNTYIIRPNYSQKFRPANVKELIHTVLGEKLSGVTYSSEESTALTKDIADSIKFKLKDLGYDRYKFIVQVVIGEQRGEGVKMGCRCFWDSDTDNYAQDIFINESLFCVAAAYGVFKY